MKGELITLETSKQIERLKRENNLRNLENKQLFIKLQKVKSRNKKLVKKEKILDEVQQYLKVRVEIIKEKYPDETLVINELEKLSVLIEKTLNNCNEISEVEE